MYVCPSYLPSKFVRMTMYHILIQMSLVQLVLLEVQRYWAKLLKDRYHGINLMCIWHFFIGSSETLCCEWVIHVGTYPTEKDWNFESKDNNKCRLSKAYYQKISRHLYLVRDVRLVLHWSQLRMLCWEWVIPNWESFKSRKTDLPSEKITSKWKYSNFIGT